MKATSKYSLTEAHRSSMLLDVPFLTPFSISAAFLIDIAETNNEDLAFDVLLKTRRVTISRMHHIVHLKLLQMQPEDEDVWRITNNASIRKVSSSSSLTRKDAIHDRYRAVARIISHSTETDRSTTHMSNRLPWITRTHRCQITSDHTDWEETDQWHPSSDATKPDAPIILCELSQRERAASLIRIGALWFCRVASVDLQMQIFLCAIKSFFLQGALQGSDTSILHSTSFRICFNLIEAFVHQNVLIV